MESHIFILRTGTIFPKLQTITNQTFETSSNRRFTELLIARRKLLFVRRKPLIVFPI